LYVKNLLLLWKSKATTGHKTSRHVLEISTIV